LLPIYCEENDINDEEGGVDMCKKLVVLCVALMLTSAVLAEEVQLNSWESQTLESWTTNNANATLIPGATRGVTDGSYSMQILGPGMTWWNENAMLDVAVLDPTGGLDAVYNNYRFSIDISVYADEWTMDTTVGWTTSPTVGLLLNPGSGQWWEMPGISIGEPAAKYGNPGADYTITASWNYAQYRDQITNFNGVCKFILKFVDYGYLGNASFYVDNARLTPEPTTIALLGLGSLALLRRKK
jgi:hypothetical protein